jgi:general secretion pathway protein L
MQAFETIRNEFSAWLDRVAEVAIAAIVRFKSIPTISLVEGEDGHLSVLPEDKHATGTADAGLKLENGHVEGRPPPQLELALKGGRVELLLRSERFVFKTLELPSRAAEFLTGVVRSQVDRLTPWSPDKAVFGVSAPVDVGGGRIAVTVAATDKGMLGPYVQAFTALGACSVKISTRAAEAAPDVPTIEIVQENVGGILDIRLARKLLLGVLACALLIAATANIASALVNNSLQARQDELARQIARTRAAALATRNAPGDPKTLAERALVGRKNQSPSPVVALEILSQILPDDTYLTDLRIESDKLRLTGITREAPNLIRLIEQSHHFSQAAFFAPITRSSTDPGDRFNIEARMEPDFSLTP